MTKTVVTNKEDKGFNEYQGNIPDFITVNHGTRLIVKTPLDRIIILEAKQYYNDQMLFFSEEHNRYWEEPAKIGETLQGYINRANGCATKILAYTPQ